MFLFKKVEETNKYVLYRLDYKSLTFILGMTSIAIWFISFFTILLSGGVNYIGSESAASIVLLYTFGISTIGIIVFILLDLISYIIIKVVPARWRRKKVEETATGSFILPRLEIKVYK